MTSNRIWYGAYGSNILRARFLCYLQGGRYLSHHPKQSGARDSQQPGRTAPLVHGPWNLCFGRSSERWEGGVAFLDPQRNEGACVRCWDITQEQFADVAAQENGLQPGEITIDIEEVIRKGKISIGDTWYSRVVYLGRYRERPLLTFTSENVPEPTSPGEPYLSVIMSGLMEASPNQEKAHIERLLRAPGVAPTWTRDAISELAKQKT